MAFFHSKKPSRIFVVQDDGTYGNVSRSPEVQALGEADGHLGRRVNAPNRQFLGRTIPARRYRFAALVVFLVFCVLIGRAVHLQIREGDHYRALAEGNRFRTYTVIPPRGIVYDRNGRALIENVPAFQLNVVAADIAGQESERTALLARIAELAGMSEEEMRTAMAEAEQTPLEPVPIKRDIPYESAIRLAIETKDLPGFRLDTATKRFYKLPAQSLSHVLGYVGSINPEELESLKDQGYRRVDSIGKAGIEKGAESLLRGVPGKQVVEVDAFGNELKIVSKEDPVIGSNVVLTIDADLQQFIEQKMLETFSKTNTSRGSVVAIDPQTGAIRALVSLPAYENNSFSGGVDSTYYAELLKNPDNPLFPRAISGEFPSGSTFKPFIAYAALAEGIIDEKFTVTSVGGIRIGAWSFPDWLAGGHGVTDVRKAIAMSVNTFFYIVGGGYQNITGLGVDRIVSYASKFGFGAKTGIELPGEADGFLPSQQWKKETKGEPWYVGDTYHLAIGQGDLLVTPLQLARGLAEVANRGYKVQPHVIQPPEGEKQVSEGGKRIDGLNQHALDVVRDGMRQTVEAGSGRRLSTLPLPTGGKTGTAQAPGGQENHAWYVGFGPYDHPDLAVVVLVEEGKEGSAVAVPIAYDIFQWWFQKEHGQP